jgi:hypothetical protein
VKGLLAEEADEEVIIPADGLALEPDGSRAGRSILKR